MEDVSVGTNGGGVPALPGDVHREIFFRLPARCLCRARAVCRSWRDLASEPSFLRAHAARTAASPFLLTWSDTVTKRDNTRDCTVHLRIHQDQDDRGRRTGDRPSAAAGDDDGDHGHRSRCCDLRLVLTARYPSISGAMRSWDGILCVEMWVRPQPPPFVAEHVPCSYLLLNPISRACTVASAPTLRVGEPGGRLDRGYIAGAYSHPVTGVFHLLHSSSSGSAVAGCGGEQQTTPRFRLQTVDSPDATWREVPMSGDAGTAMLQTVVGRLRLQSSVTVHGRLHWRVARSQTRPRHDKEELLVFHAADEEFGRMALPRLHEAGAVKQQAISTLAGKLCLLAGLASSSTAVEVWVVEDYDAQDWRLRHVIHANRPSPLHIVHVLDSALGNVGLLVGGVRGDEVEEILFYNCLQKAYNVRPGSSSTSVRQCQGLAVHEQSLLPHNVIFGTMPRVQGIAFLRGIWIA
uniref:F-box domain-containing protein n=1 Tax=Setaria italica TaxID=4555 RepID=K4ALE2_SETIT